jgi:hypothetical protein
MIPILYADNLAKLPSIKHGFFTRRGGVSEGIFAELNIREKGDNPIHIQENRRRIAASLGFDSHNLVTVKQTHSANVFVVDKPIINGLPEADALITSTPGLLVGIMTADCVPILLSTTKGDMVAAVHAGWKGAVSGVIENTVQKMKDLGAKDIMAALGPCIWQDNYEVSQEFYEQFAKDPSFAPSFFKTGARPQHWQFDLPGYVIDRLKHAGIQVIQPSLANTYTDPERFFSCRRATHLGEPTFGDAFSGIGIKL